MQVVVFDCSDPDGLSRFCAETLHYKAQNPPEGFKSWEESLETWGIPEEDWNFASAMVYPEGKGPRIYFQQMDAPKLGKNRLHLDVNASGGSPATIQDRKAQFRAEVERLLKLGAMQREWEER